MGYCTSEIVIKNARKQHICDWCGEAIKVLDSYVRWACIDYGSAITARAHTECLDAAQTSDSPYREDFVFNRKNRRGCDCGDGCEKCEEANDE